MIYTLNILCYTSRMKNFLCICFSSTLQKTVTFPNVKLEAVNRSEHYRLDASGKAVNAARVLAQLEKDCVTTFCPLGENDYRLFERLAEQDNLNLIYSKIPGNTRECLTLLDKSAGTTTEIVISEPPLKRTKGFEATERAIVQVHLPTYMEEADAVMLAGSRPSLWSDDVYPTLAKAAIDSGKILLVDYHGKDLLNTLKICTPSIIKINEDEFSWTFGAPQDDKSAPQDNKSASPEQLLKAQITAKSLDLKNIIIVTRGSKSTFAANNGTFIECPTEKITPVNTTACGDSFNAGFLYEYTNTANFEAALQKATWCAARNAESEIPGSIR